MDIASLTFLGLIGIGAVNVISFFRPGLDSRVKIALCFLVVFAFSYVPADIANELLAHAKDALAVVLAGSGAYKMSQNTGRK